MILLSLKKGGRKDGGWRFLCFSMTKIARLKDGMVLPSDFDMSYSNVQSPLRRWNVFCAEGDLGINFCLVEIDKKATLQYVE